MTWPTLDDLGAEAQLGTIQIVAWLIAVAALAQVIPAHFGGGVVAGSIGTVIAVAVDPVLRRRGFGCPAAQPAGHGGDPE